MPAAKVTINSRNYDQSIRRSWTCDLIRQQGDLIELVGEFAFDVDHPDLGQLTKGTISYEYYWLDRWFNVFQFHEPEGSFRNWYCNINMPPHFEKGVLDYVDLDIDILIWPSGEIVVLDEEEFAVNAEKFGYPPAIRSAVESARSSLLTRFHKCEFPFDCIA